MTALDPRAELVSAHDASFIPKSGKQTFGFGYFFNGCASRAERGLEISTLAVVEVTRRCCTLTLAVAQTPPGEDATEGRAGRDPGSTSTRSHCVSIGIACRWASPIIVWTATDAKKKYIDEVDQPRSARHHQTTEQRPTACCSIPVRTRKQSGARRKYDGKVNFQTFEPFRGPRNHGR